MMMAQQYELWLANLNPGFGTEAGKTRPVIIIQTDLLNAIHTSVVICPVTTNVQLKANILRVHLKKGESNVKNDCDIMVDQMRAIDIKRLIKRTGVLHQKRIDELNENIKIVLGL
jgi:mRNA interferase MazF